MPALLDLDPEWDEEEMEEDIKAIVSGDLKADLPEAKVNE